MNVMEDTQQHIDWVEKLLLKVAAHITMRAGDHDKSKLETPEKEMYETWRPKLDAISVESAEYRDALVKMGPALNHHYEVNRHHPEHFENGIAGMNLIDLLEMTCDWVAAAGRSGKKVNPEWAQKRFGIESQLLSVIMNTIGEFE